MLLLLLNYVVLRALWKIDVHVISTLVNKSLHYYYYNTKLLAKLACGDMATIDAQYHVKCLAKLYKRAQLSRKDQDKTNQKRCYTA